MADTLLTVYSCVAGSIDNPDWLFGSQPKPDPRIRYVLFTDRLKAQMLQSLTGLTWEVRPLQWIAQLNPRRSARYHKILAHSVFPDAELTLWLDGSLQVIEGTDLWALCQQVLQAHSIATFAHPERQCVYQEHRACARLRKDDKEVMRKQLDRYRAAGMPPYAGLVETSCLFRRHDADTVAFNTAWWQEISSGSLRDQLSFNYVAWKLGAAWGIVPGCRAESPYFRHHVHRMR